MVVAVRRSPDDQWEHPVKILTLAFASVLSLFASSALASNNGTFGPNQQVPGTGGNPYQPQITVTDCATGFDKSNVSGSPSSNSYSYECKTPLIVCPPAPAGLSGGMSGPVAVAQGKGEVFKYYCSWNVPPK